MSIMIDIETLGTQPDSVILSIAVVQFDEYGDTERVLFHTHINGDVQKAQGRTVDPATMQWWSEQSEEARKRIEEGQCTDSHPDAVRNALANVLASMGPEEGIWANGPDFDCVLLRDFMGPTYKWPFWKHRCVRTLKGLWPDLANSVEKPKVAHDAVEDCLYQIRQVQAVLAG